MMERKPLPIGIEDFKEVIDSGYYFVDKTLMIKDLIVNKVKVGLFTRPRRFGKTLNMSMIQRFFEKTAESNAYLFDRLKISEYPECMQYQGQYPVISISLKSMKQATFEEAFAVFKDLIRAEILRHKSVLFQNDAIEKTDLDRLTRFIELKAENEFRLTKQELLDAITDKTKVIVAVHYAGVACEMDTIMDIARRHDLKVVEDAAQGVMSSYKGKALGTIGDFGCYSFHETKNYSMGEGGALVINNPAYNERAEILREKGTNRAKFFRGQVDKYTWVDFGDSYLPSELNAAYLWAQLLHADEINDNRMATWNAYHDAFRPLADAGRVELPTIPADCVHNAHMFYLKCRDLEERTALIRHLKANDILAVFHYIPLHSAPAGQKFGRFDGADVYTTAESERLVRLPMYYGLTEADRNKVIAKVLEFYAQ